MKKNYTLLFLFFSLLSSSISFGQLLSLGNIDTCEGAGSVDLLTMVTLNGVTPTAAQVTFSVVNSNNTDLFLMGNTIIFGAGLTSGNWTLTYQACETANTSNCVTAQVTVRVVKPTIANVVQPTCNTQFGTVVLSNMPPGYWEVTANGGVPLVQGNADICTITGLVPATVYVFTITNSIDCSATITPVIIQPQPITSSFTIVPQTCEFPSNRVKIENLPQGNWALSYHDVDDPSLITIYGFGSSYTITNLSTPGDFIFKVTNDMGCSSQVMTYLGTLNNAISGTMTAAYVDYNNDGITNLGDIIQYSVAITNNLTCVMETVNYRIGNSSSIIGTFTNLAAGATANGTLNYPLTQLDINNGSVFNWLAVSSISNGYESYIKIFDQNQTVTLALPDGIKLNAFFDANNDGVQNNGEQNSNQGNFTYQLNNDSINHNLYSQSGTNIIYESNPTNSYDFSCNLYNNCSGEYNISATTYSNITVPTGSGITTYNFPITQGSCQDVQVYLYGWAPRPGFSYSNSIIYQNIGNQTLTSGTITFTKDAALSITSVSQAGVTTTATGFAYTFTNLLPNETRTILVTLLVPTIPTVSLGQLVTGTATITTPAGDVNSSNNTSVLTQVITNSYDPNDKTEVHGGKILHSTFTANDYLTYMIRFENTGTAAAINIRVHDVLDAKLDESSIKMVRASHPYVLDRVGSNLNWRFNGVNLPPSIPNDELTGHGYIVFQVKPKTGFALGDIIPNTADIFFDFNPAIVTNTCSTEFVAALGVNAFDADTFEYYPNPTSDIVTFAFKNTSTTIDTIEVMDVLGKTLISKTIHYNNTTIDLSALTTGMYLVTLKANGQTKTVKISKH